MKGITSKFLLALALVASVPIACDGNTDPPGNGGTAAAGQGGSASGSGGSKSNGGRTSTGGVSSGGRSTEPGGAGGEPIQTGGSGGVPDPAPTGGMGSAGEPQGGAGIGGETPTEGGAPQGGQTSQGGAGGRMTQPDLCELTCDIALSVPACAEISRESCLQRVCEFYDWPNYCGFDQVLECWAFKGTPEMFACRDGKVFVSTSTGPCYDAYGEYMERPTSGGSCDEYEKP